MSTTEEDDKIVDRSNILNINVGILGHVDSGKTSLVKALSTSLSTAALDKNPQSQERGITLDLGFSSFTLPMPEHLIEEQKNDTNNNDNFEFLQFTLVDCPGHASLIRTIIGGAQIIDMMVLVIDVNKGIQTQTAECIVIGEITTDKLIIVLNKIDSLPEEDRDNRIEKMTNRIRKIFATTKFANAPIIATAAAIGGEKVASVGAATASEKSIRGGSKSNAVFQKQQTVGVDTLVELIHSSASIPKRNTEGSLYFAIDHCFPIKGHGTVLTGTVLNGSVSINSLIEIPELQIQRKVKSMQMFRKPVKSARQGDRVGICVTSLDAKTVERGIASTPGSIPLLSSVICMVKKVRFFKGICKTNDRFHVSVGHTTITATALFFGSFELTTLLGLDNIELENKSSTSVGIENNTEDEFNLLSNSNNNNNNGRSNTSNDSVKLNNKSKNNLLKSNLVQTKQSALNATYQNNFPEINYDYDNEYIHQSELAGGENLSYGKEPVQWVLLQFQQPVFCPIGSLIIGSRLDADSGDNGSQCRLAFYGPVRESIKKDDFDKIKVFHWKEKIGEVYKLTEERNGLCYELIGWKLVQEGNIVTPFIGMKLETEDGNLGKITGLYGSGGQFKVRFTNGVKISIEAKLILKFKRYIYDKKKKMVQSEINDDNDNESDKIDNNVTNNISNSIPITDSIKSLSVITNEKIKIVIPTAITYENVQISSPLIVNKTLLQESMIINNNKDFNKNDTKKLNLDNKDKIIKNQSIVPIITSVAPEISTIKVAKKESEFDKVMKKMNSIPKKVPNSKPVNTIISSKSSSNTKKTLIETSNSKINYSNILSNENTLATVTISNISTRFGIIDSFKTLPGTNDIQCIVSGAFKVEENIRLYIGSKVYCNNCISIGELTGPFAKLGKCKVLFNNFFRGNNGDKIEIRINDFN